jgi:hypothetical protein
VLKSVLFLVCVYLLASCATTSRPTYYYNEVVVRNNTKSIVQDVTIRADQSQRMFGCSNIAPLGQCSDQFPKRQYLASPIRIAWIIGNRNWQTEEFVLEIPESYNPTIVLRGVLELQPDGSMNAFFEQGKAE